MGKKSVLWQHYIKLDAQTAQCRICKKKIKTSGNTSNLKCHLSSCHKEVLEKKDIDSAPSSSQSVSTDDNMSSRNVVNLDLDSEDESPGNSKECTEYTPPAKKEKIHKTIKETFQEISSYKQGDKASKITEAILFLITRDSQPISIVEDEGFCNLLRVTAPHYKIPHRKTITRLLEKKYDVLANIMRDTISKLEYYCLTTDIWTDSMQSRSFLGLTIHFEQNQELVAVVLGVFELSQRHTSEYIVQQLKQIFSTWDVSVDKVTAIVSDGAANISKALETMFGKRKILHCFAHQLNLVVQRAIQSVDELVSLITKIKNIVTWFKQSNNASDELRATQYERGGAIKKLLQEVPTRWNSTFYMIERFLELEESINAIIHRNPSAPVMVDAREIITLREILELLRPLEAATKEVSGDTYTTSSIVIPLANNLHRKLSQREATTVVGKNLKTALIKECEKRFYPSSEQVYILAISTLLDPRFKKMYFRELNAAKAVEMVQNILRTMDPKSTSAGDNANNEVDVIEPVENNHFSLLWDDHQKMMLENNGQKNDISSLTELSSFLKAPVESSLQTKPIVWWRSVGTMYPNLHKVANKFLACIATSVPSERLFSKAGDIVTKKRNRLNGKRLSMILFMQSVPKNYWDNYL